MTANGPVRVGFGLMALALLAGCGDGGTGPDPAVNPLDTVPPLRSLGTVAGLEIGSAAGGPFFQAGGEAYRLRLAQQFDVLTPENDMKHASIQPDRGTFAFERGDSLVRYAEAHGMRVRGHTLVWHRQLAPWLTEGTWSAAEADALLREHISAVVGHYQGRVGAWDVVNEAVDADGSVRSTFWSEHVGPDYIETAFRTANQADPAALLFYNDYGIAWLNQKSDSVYSLLADLRGRGVPVHGIGFQGHFEVGNLPARADLVANFQRFGDLGLEVHVTELDVRIRTTSAADRASQLRQQADDYRRVVEACLAVQACTVVATWGFTDAASWIPATFPGWGDATLLDRDLEPKPAYWAVHEALGG